MSTTQPNDTPAIVPLIWRKPDVAAALDISLREFERMVSSGRFPRPDVRIGRSPRWKPETVRNWIDEQARKGARR